MDGGAAPIRVQCGSRPLVEYTRAPLLAKLQTRPVCPRVKHAAVPLPSEAHGGLSCHWSAMRTGVRQNGVVTATRRQSKLWAGKSGTERVAIIAENQYFVNQHFI